MGLVQLFNYKKKRFTLLDVASDEIAMFALAFLIAKYWITVTYLAWYWYVIIKRNGLHYWKLLQMKLQCLL